MRIGYPCRGIGVCSRCVVEVQEGASHLEPPGPRERLLLERMGASSHERLACLAEVREDGPIVLRVGPEVIAGSTRMKGGLAQKMVLHLLSTTVMVRLGCVSGNLMSQLRPASAKLRDRAVRILMELGRIDEATRRAVDLIVSETAGGSALRLNLMISYGGREELIRSARLLAERVQRGQLDPDQIDEAAVEDTLFTRRATQLRYEVMRRLEAEPNVAGVSFSAGMPGLESSGQIEVEGTPYPVVAETGVQWGADGAYIWSVVDGRAQRVPVQIVQRQQGRVLVDGDIERGALVVIEGIQRMRDGIDVSYEPPNIADRHPETLNGATPQGGE